MCPDPEIPKQPREAAHRSESQTQGSCTHCQVHTLAQPPKKWSLSPQNRQPETQRKEQPFSIFLHQGILKSQIHCPNAERKVSTADHSSHRHFQSTDRLLRSALEGEAKTRKQIFCL